MEATQTLEAVDVIIPIVELEKINATDIALAQLHEKAVELASTPVDSKEQYDEVHKFVMMSVKVRTGAKAIAEQLAAPHKDMADRIISEGKRIGEKAKECETMVRPIKDAYEEQQERIKREKAEAEAAKITARINELFKLGAIPEGASYNICGVYIDAIEVQKLPDAEWLDLYNSAKAAFDAEVQRLAEQQAERDREDARIAAEQEAIRQEQEQERIRLEAARAEQDRKEAEFKAAQAEQERKQREFEAQQAEFQRQQAEAENKRLQAIADEEARQRRIQQEEEARQREAEAARLREITTERVAKLLAAGFELDSDDGLIQRYVCGYLSVDSSNIAHLSSGNIGDLVDEAKLIVKERAEKEAEQVKQREANLKAQQQADTDRQARLAPDKEKMIKYFNKVSTLPGPALKEAESTTLINQFYRDIDKVVNDYKAYIETL